MTRKPYHGSFWRRAAAGVLLALMLLTPVLALTEDPPAEDTTADETGDVTPTELLDVMYVYNPEPTNRLNLRAGPSLESESLARFYTGTAVEVLGASGEFTNVRVGDLVGYMQTTFLSATRVPLELGLWASVSLDDPTEKLHLRAQTTEGAISLGLFYTGTSVQILEDAGEHYRVRLIDMEGYMAKNFLQVDGTPGKQDLTKLTNGLMVEPTALYAFPSRNATSLGMHYAGETVEILGVAGTWYYVEVGGQGENAHMHQRGFMPGQVLKVSDYNAAQGQSSYTYAVVRNADEKVKQVMRSQPAWSSDALGMFINAAQVLVLDTLPEEDIMPLWVHVSIGGLEGYMLGEHLGRVYKAQMEPQPIDYTEPTAAPDAIVLSDDGEEDKTPTDGGTTGGGTTGGIVIPTTEGKPDTTTTTDTGTEEPAGEEEEANWG